MGIRSWMLAFCVGRLRGRGPGSHLHDVLWAVRHLPDRRAQEVGEKRQVRQGIGWEPAQE